ncbi:MAG: hydantoinase/oxoprolinase family protein, partial [Spirochaetaceae bacterium]|nr:hydantoinase/oxoprolinase family protein [Spirochaetaceae bacterium]
MTESRPACRVGVDIGGTFTGIVALTEDGRSAVVKVASTPDDYGRGVLRGLADALAELDLPAAGVAEIVHGFTVATNAILEGKGAQMALITTEGFRDVLEIARLRTPRLYDLYYRKPPPLVERRLRLEVRERVDARGRVLAPLDAGDVERAVAAVREADVSSVAVCLLHSYANPEHEQRVGEALRAALPEVDVSLSSELLPEAREYERTSTTVVNGYIRPVVERYLQRLVAELRRTGTDAPVTVMQSNGGVMPVELAARQPMYCIQSGPPPRVIRAAANGS